MIEVYIYIYIYYQHFSQFTYSCAGHHTKCDLVLNLLLWGGG